MFNVIWKRKLLICAVFTANISIFSAGMMEAWTSPVLPKMSHPGDIEDNPLGTLLTEHEGAWIGGVLSIGAAIGPFPAAFAADRFGRKVTLVALGVPMVASFLILAFARNLIWYYVARVLGGLAVGGVFSILPTYIAEVSEVPIRGMLSTSMNIFEVAGLMLSYCLGPYLKIEFFNVVSAVIPFIFLITFVMMPESPYFLVGQGRTREAEESLKRLRAINGGKVEKEMEEIKECVDKYTGIKFTDIFKTRSNIKALTVSLALISFQQLSGINIVIMYTQFIFEATGSTIPSDLSSIIIGAVQVLAAFITPMVVDRLGRRVLLMISAIGMVLSEVPLGAYFYLHRQGGYDVEKLYWLPMLCLMVYIVVFNFGFGPLPWTVMSEIFPDNVKAISTSLTTCVCWALSFVMTTYFHDLSAVIGIAGSFWIYSAFNILAAFFIFFCVPETKNKSFQTIQEELQAK